MRQGARRYSPAAMRRSADASLVLLWAIMVTGATVRLTGSGLGCPDWPSCSGVRPVPQLEYHALVEFFNRMVSLPTLLATIMAWHVARRLATPRPDLRLSTGMVLVGVLMQVVVGGLTVRLELPPSVVSVHFVISIAILAAATFSATVAREAVPVRLRLRRAPLASVVVAGMLVACIVTIVLGVLTTAAGPHSGAEPGLVVARMGDAALAVKLHARAAYAFAALVIALTVWRRRSHAGARDFALLTGLVVVQVALGEIQYRTGLPWYVVLAHVGTAALVWIAACRVAIDALATHTTPPFDS